MRQALQQGYIEDACQAPGFVAYLTVEDEEGDFATVAVFRSQNDLANFANAEANWIAQNLDDLLPAPDEAISGDTYVHAVAPQGFPTTCPAPAAPTAAPAAPTSAPGQPTAAPSQPTAVPSGPTPTPAPACTAQGCVCATGTQAPCDDGLVCCPTTDLMGGPGVCQPQNVCYPNDCRANGRSCPRSCGTTEACPSCCSNYCNADGVCDDPPAPCTGEGCTCATGTQSPCDDGLICCGTTGVPGGPGLCQTDAECNPPCTGEGCACNGGVQGNCDDGLVCCQGGQSIPGGAGTCVAESECAPPPCTGQGCDCNGGVQGACDDGLICCQEDGSIPGGPGTCQTADACGPPSCTSDGGGCDASCNWGDSCSGCCSGYCNDSGVCDEEPSSATCISDGVNCGTTCNWSDSCDACCSGFCDGAGNCNEPGASAGACGDQGCGCELGNPDCDDGLLCCDDGSGVTGTCQTGC